MGRKMFDVCFYKAKNSVFDLDYRMKNMFESIRYSKNDVPFCSMRNSVNVVYTMLNMMYNIHSFEAGNKVFEIDYH